MLRFRNRIVFSNLVILTVGIAIVYPFVQWTVNWISHQTLDKPLINQLQEAKDLEEINQIMELRVQQVKRDFKIGVLILAVILLVAISLFDMLMVHYITRPIQWIINAIRPYQEGREEFLPKIVLKEIVQNSELSRLADTLNSLNEKIQRQIESLTLQKKETEEILESLGEGIIATDASAKVSFVNKAACRMIGMARENVFRQMLDQVEANSSDLAKKCHELILNALQTSQSMSQGWTEREKGTTFLELISAPLAYRSGALLVLQDKTSDLKVVEMGKEFIANASHELRTPITIIRGFAETLPDLPNLTQEMLKEITDKITRTCIRFEKLIRSLLTLTDVENLSEERLRTSNLVLLAENCRHFLQTAYPKVGLRFKKNGEEAPILADPDLIELAISNLLENGVKYSEEPAEIDLEVRIQESEVELVVKDRGIGISEKDIPRICERFYRVDKARSRKSGGAGLGLSIVKTIAEKHKGSIQVESTLGKGSTFTMTFPLQLFK